MRENRTYGSEGGEDLVLPDPYRLAATRMGRGPVRFGRIDCGCARRGHDRYLTLQAQRTAAHRNSVGYAAATR